MSVLPRWNVISIYGSPISPNREMKESRVFIPRNSILTDLLRQPHIQSLRSVFAATLIIVVIQVTVNDIVQDGRYTKEWTILPNSLGLDLI